MTNKLSHNASDLGKKNLAVTEVDRRRQQRMLCPAKVGGLENKAYESTPATQPFIRADDNKESHDMNRLCHQIKIDRKRLTHGLMQPLTGDRIVEKHN